MSRINEILVDDYYETFCVDIIHIHSLSTLIMTRKAIEMTDTIRAQTFVSVMCRKTSTTVSGTTKYPTGRSIARPSSNGIWVHTEMQLV